MSLKLTMQLDDEATRNQLLDFMREQARPCLREVVAEKLTDRLVEKVVANFLAGDAIHRIAQELKWHVTQAIIQSPDVLSRLEKLDKLAGDAVNKALEEKNLRPVIDSSVRRAIGSLLSRDPSAL